MAIIKYNLNHTFDKDGAASGKLCVCILTTVPTTTTYILSNDTTGGFVGAGICVYKDYKFHLTINGSLYVFNDKGAAANNTAVSERGVGCLLVMGTVVSDAVSRGNVVNTHINGTDPTRGSSGSYSPSSNDTYGNEVGVLIENLNARDHFAAQALQMLLARMEKDPATISDNEMSYLSDVAYRWAANMMAAAANARAGMTDSTPAATSEVTVQSLENNTEKLLNNIEAALKRTDQNTAGAGQDPVYAERIINPSLNTWLTNYIDDGQGGTVGLKDLIDALGQGGLASTVNIGSLGLGNDVDNPIFVSPGSYATIAEAESDGWTFNAADNVWHKAGYVDIPGTHNLMWAQTLPKGRNAISVSIIGLPALIDALDRITDKLDEIKQAM